MLDVMSFSSLGKFSIQHFLLYNSQKKERRGREMKRKEVMFSVNSKEEEEKGNLLLAKKYAVCGKKASSG